MSSRVVWLASFPKSGNTWMRAIVTALSTHPHLFAVNKLGSGAEPFMVATAMDRWGLDARWMDRSELATLRSALIAADANDPNSGAGGDDNAPQLRKTHERWRPGSAGAEPFPTDLTRAAILVVRDPRDVACSYAPFFGIDVDAAIEEMAAGRPQRKDSPAALVTDSPWGDWSTHTRSWLDPNVGFPVHVIHFEDLKADAVGTLAPVFDAIGMGCTLDQLAAAVEQARFERLAASEASAGFREVSPDTVTFFRQGRSGAWRDDLSAAHVAAIEADHGDVMAQLGYELTSPDDIRLPLAEARASRRRQGNRRTLALPGHLGLTATLGDIPAKLPGATQPLPGLQVTDDAVRVDFGGGRALLVEHGTTATVQWDLGPGEDPADLSWVTEGWAVTLAALQRGNLTMHASSVGVGDAVVAVAGHHGAGKSTTAMGLRARGHNLLIDDSTVVDVTNTGAWTTPYARNVHLMADAAAAVGVDFDALPALAGRGDKSSFRPEGTPAVPHRIDMVLVLEPTEAATGISLTQVTGTDKVTALGEHVARQTISHVVLGPVGLFDQLTRLADACDVWVLSRPTDSWSLDAVLDAIESLAADVRSQPATRQR